MSQYRIDKLLIIVPDLCIPYLRSDPHHNTFALSDRTDLPNLFANHFTIAIQHHFTNLTRHSSLLISHMLHCPWFSWKLPIYLPLQNIVPHCLLYSSHLKCKLTINLQYIIIGNSNSIIHHIIHNILHTTSHINTNSTVNTVIINNNEHNNPTTNRIKISYNCLSWITYPSTWLS